MSSQHSGSGPTYRQPRPVFESTLVYHSPVSVREPRLVTPSGRLAKGLGVPEACLPTDACVQRAGVLTQAGACLEPRLSTTSRHLSLSRSMSSSRRLSPRVGFRLRADTWLRADACPSRADVCLRADAGLLPTRVHHWPAFAKIALLTGFQIPRPLGLASVDLPWRPARMAASLRSSWPAKRPANHTASQPGGQPARRSAVQVTRQPGDLARGGQPVRRPSPGRQHSRAIGR